MYLPIAALLAFGLTLSFAHWNEEAFLNAFPDCTNDTSVCDGNTHYPHCVRCSSDLALCSANTKGCGCAIPENENRVDGTGSFLDHGEEYLTRIHCLHQRNLQDLVVRNYYRCENTQLLLKSALNAPCKAPNSTCVDREPGELIGPKCVQGGGSGSVSTFVSGTALVLAAAISFLLLH